MANLWRGLGRLANESAAAKAALTFDQGLRNPAFTWAA
jgi:hypothetical protein